MPRVSIIENHAIARDQYHVPLARRRHQKTVVRIFVRLLIGLTNPLWEDRDIDRKGWRKSQEPYPRRFLLICQPGAQIGAHQEVSLRGFQRNLPEREDR